MKIKQTTFLYKNKQNVTPTKLQQAIWAMITPIVSPLSLFLKLNSRSSIWNVVFGFHFFLILYNSVSIVLE